jgi:Tol biopolymer transport system component
MVGGDKLEEGPILLLHSVEAGEQKRLTSPAPYSLGDSCRSLSPDGGTLAFFRWTSWSNSDLYILDLTREFGPAGQAKRLTFGNWRASSPAWNPDGKTLIFSASSSLRRVGTSGTDTPQRLTSSPAGSGDPSWSKDGRWILYAQVDTAGSDLMLPENFR